MNKEQIADLITEAEQEIKDFERTSNKTTIKLIGALKEAINYTRCSTQLKDKKTMTFTEWIESNKGYIINGDVFNEHDYQQNRNELVKRYNKIHNL